MSYSPWPKDESAAIQMAESALLMAKKIGATEAEVGLQCGVGLSVNVRMGEVDTLEFGKDTAFGVTIYVGQRKGCASTTDCSLPAIEQTVQAAYDIARSVQPDRVSGFPDLAELAMHSDPAALSLNHPWQLEADQAIAMAQACESQARHSDPRIVNSEGVSISSYHNGHVLANSAGFLGHYASTRHSMSCLLVAKSGDKMQQDGWYTTARSPETLDSAERVAQQSVERVLARLGARSLPTQEVPVIFAAEVARGLLGGLCSALSGSALYRNASFLCNQLGERIAPEWFVLEEKPFIPQALGSAPYDSEGVKTREKMLIQQGVLQSYLLGTYSARRLGLSTTGNAGGIYNGIVQANVTGGLPALLALMGKGLLVTEAFGSGLNVLTGDYSQAVSGFWVENGTIQFPVDEITVAGNMRDILQNLQAVSDDYDQRGKLRTGSCWVARMTVAGQSTHA